MPIIPCVACAMWRHMCDWLLLATLGGPYHASCCVMHHAVLCIMLCYASCCVMHHAVLCTTGFPFLDLEDRDLDESLWGAQGRQSGCGVYVALHSFDAIPTQPIPTQWRSHMSTCIISTSLHAHGHMVNRFAVMHQPAGRPRPLCRHFRDADQGIFQHALPAALPVGHVQGGMPAQHAQVGCG
jgi:hypothetical protein